MAGYKSYPAIFIFLNKNKRKMIYKNIISFTILYFTDVFKRHFENVFLPHEKGDSR